MFISISIKKRRDLKSTFKMALPVEIEKQRILKPYLGGWRHKITGIEYINAASQTGSLSKQISWENTYSRAVQCVQTKDEATQSLHHCATQMWRY